MLHALCGKLPPNTAEGGSTQRNPAFLFSKQPRKVLIRKVLIWSEFKVSLFAFLSKEGLRTPAMLWISLSSWFPMDRRTMEFRTEGHKDRHNSRPLPS